MSAEANLQQEHARNDISTAPQILPPLVPRKDDLDCVEQLSMGPPTDPPCRLLFLFHVIFEECDLNRKLAIEAWLKIIEGAEGREDLWSWEDGDEEWLRSNIRRPQPAYSRSRIYPEDWEQAGIALQTRLSRAYARIPIHDTPRSRIFTIGWRILASSYIMNTRTRRGLAPQRDTALDIRAWYSSIHLLFEFPDVNHIELRDTFFPALRGDTHQCTTDMSMIKDWVSIMPKLLSREQLVVVCKTICRCDECAAR